MRRIVSELARDELREIVGFAVTQMLESEHRDTEHLVTQICEWYEAQNTFSDAVHDGQISKRCPTCKGMYVYYRKPFPLLMCRYLKLLEMLNCPCTVKEIEEKSGIEREFDESSHFPTLRYWGLISECPEARYKITEKGRQFLRGDEQVREYLWIFRGEPVAAPYNPEKRDIEKEGTYKYLRELKHKTYSLDALIQSAVAALANPLHV